MSRPIWNEVESCTYQGNKSYGVNETGRVNVKVGSSAKNSHHFVEHIVTRRFYNNEKMGDICAFKFSVDGIVLKIMYFTNDKGKAGKHIKTVTKLNSIKSL